MYLMLIARFNSVLCLFSPIPPFEGGLGDVIAFYMLYVPFIKLVVFTGKACFKS